MFQPCPVPQETDFRVFHRVENPRAPLVVRPIPAGEKWRKRGHGCEIAAIERLEEVKSRDVVYVVVV